MLGPEVAQVLADLHVKNGVDVRTSDPDSYAGGDVEKPELLAFWTAQGVVLAGMNVNVRDVADDIEALMGSRKPTGTDRLADAAAPLRPLLEKA
ncbi:hypothetical protein [Longivirga aurantiaca]|uniref:Uncharacterized protein n=1 Tax=Longivirga aurantiaca TaxID=1837743 RepID=A0ABW1T0L6_9ACTN